MYKDIVTIEFDDETVGIMYHLLKSEIDRFVEREGGDKKRGCYIDSSRKSKFSMHYVNDSMTLDRNYISMKILSFYLSRFIWSRINEYFISWYLRFTKMNTRQMMLDKDNKLLHAVFRMLMLEKQANNVGWCGMHNTPVDECV